MSNRERTKALHVRVFARELAQLRALARHRDENASQIVRRFIREAYAQTFPEKTAAQAPTSEPTDA